LFDLLGEPRVRPILIFAMLVLLVGTVLFHWLEGWSWVDAFYFCAITLFTIGYGDLTPTTDLTKILTVLYAFNGVGVLVAFATQAMQVRSERFAESRERRRM
jgi:hypothetical protein